MVPTRPRVPQPTQADPRYQPLAMSSSHPKHPPGTQKAPKRSAFDYSNLITVYICYILRSVPGCQDSGHGEEGRGMAARGRDGRCVAFGGGGAVGGGVVPPQEHGGGGRGEDHGSV